MAVFPLFFIALLYRLEGVTALAAPSNPCCESLSAALPGKIVRAGNGIVYERIRKSYWSQQGASTSPACFVQPWDTKDVATAVKILSQPSWKDVNGCKFAIRSGGHTAWSAANNIEGGVTIDLGLLKDVKISPGREVVSVGPGNRWGEVYSRIEPLGLAVSGGRWGNVGVGGLLTQGGLSFFQGREGLACDGILNHEIVLANGSIIEANSKQNADLHKALKGGSNNFGIVTRFDLKAFPQENIWGGMILDKPNQEARSLEWFQDFANSSKADPYGMTMFSFANISGYTVGGGLMTYSKPEAKPAVFSKLANSAIVSSMSMTTYGAISLFNGLSTPAGGRVLWASVSFVNSAAFMKKVQDIAHEKSAKTLNRVGSIALIFQPIWQHSRAKAFAATGGNSLGLEESKDDIVIVLAMVSWWRAADDERAKEGLKGFIDEVSKQAKEAGVYSRYIYANYAAGFQDVVGGYGESSKSSLIATSLKYDPTQLFQRQVPGGFKLRHVG